MPPSDVRRILLGVIVTLTARLAAMLVTLPIRMAVGLLEVVMVLLIVVSAIAVLVVLQVAVALLPIADVYLLRTLRDAVFTPISLGRAGYWLGRAHEAAGDSVAAADAYALGALVKGVWDNIVRFSLPGISLALYLVLVGPLGDGWTPPLSHDGRCQ